MLTQMCLSYSAERSIARFIDDNDISYFSIAQGIGGSIGFSTDETFVRQDTLVYISKKSDYIINGCVDNLEQLTEFGFSFVNNALELDNLSYYIPDFVLERAYDSSRSYVMIDDEKVKLVKELHPFEFLIGKKLDFGDFNCLDYTLAGVICTNGLNQLDQASFPNYFSLRSFLGREVSSAVSCNAGDNKELTVKYGDIRYSGEFYIDRSKLNTIDLFDGRILTKNGLEKVLDFSLNEGEIILSYDIYRALFSASSKWYYVNPDLTEVVNFPKELGLTFPLSFYEYNSEQLIFNSKNYKLVGIAFDSSANERPFGDYRIAFNFSDYNLIAQVLSQNNSILIKRDTVRNLRVFLSELRNDYQGYVKNIGQDKKIGAWFSNIAYDFETEVATFKQVFAILSAILIIVVILFMINLITFSINDRKKEIGILSALGMGNKDITRIFVYETLFISVVTFVFNIVFSFVIAAFFNAEYCKIYSLIVPLFGVDCFTVFTLFFTCFVLFTLFSFIPVRKLVKMKPIDVIKNN